MTAGAPTVLLADVREMILPARQTVARGGNAALVALYWKAGQRVGSEILREKRAEYGREIVVTLSRQLAVEFGWRSDHSSGRMVTNHFSFSLSGS
jgi:hypothetical protein